MLINIENYKIIKEVDINQVIINIMSLDFENKCVMFKVFFMNNQFNSDDSTKYVEIKGAEYEAWGSDDSYIIDLILQKLSLIQKNNI